jgi:hypothetical protein
MSEDRSYTNGNAPDVIRKSQRDTGFDIRSETHWALTIGV